MFPESHVGFAASLLELFKLFGLEPIVTIRDGVDEMVRQHKRYSLSADTELLLVMSEKMSKVYVENLTV